MLFLVVWLSGAFAPPGSIFADGELASGAAVPAGADPVLEPAAPPAAAPPAAPPAAPGAAASNGETGAPARASATAKVHVLFNITSSLCRACTRRQRTKRSGERGWWRSLLCFTVTRPTWPKAGCGPPFDDRFFRRQLRGQRHRKPRPEFKNRRSYISPPSTKGTPPGSRTCTLTPPI
jgi:hypothetical protein